MDCKQFNKKPLLYEACKRPGRICKLFLANTRTNPLYSTQALSRDEKEFLDKTCKTSMMARTRVQNKNEEEEYMSCDCADFLFLSQTSETCWFDSIVLGLLLPKCTRRYFMPYLMDRLAFTGWCKGYTKPSIRYGYKERKLAIGNLWPKVKLTASGRGSPPDFIRRLFARAIPTSYTTIVSPASKKLTVGNMPYFVFYKSMLNDSKDEAIYTLPKLGSFITDSPVFAVELSNDVDAHMFDDNDDSTMKTVRRVGMREKVFIRKNEYVLTSRLYGFVATVEDGVNVGHAVADVRCDRDIWHRYDNNKAMLEKKLDPITFGLFTTDFMNVYEIYVYCRRDWDGLPGTLNSFSARSG